MNMANWSRNFWGNEAYNKIRSGETIAPIVNREKYPLHEDISQLTLQFLKADTDMCELKLLWCPYEEVTEELISTMDSTRGS